MRPDILSVAGKYFSFVEPETCEFGIYEIAHALSHLCRFTGHTREFYSVAQHSVAVSHLVPPEHALAGLLHDSAEAFVGDMASPLKRLLPNYKAIESRIEKVVLARFGLPSKLPDCVKEADLVMLLTEKRDLLPAHDDVWEAETLRHIRPLDAPIVALPSQEARQLFLNRYSELSGDWPWNPAKHGRLQHRRPVMLDVMHKPSPMLERITWIASRVQLPDDNTFVLVFGPKPLPVWMGWYDAKCEVWRDLEGHPIELVTWWARFPSGPCEPKPGDAPVFDEVLAPRALQIADAQMFIALERLGVPLGSEGMVYGLVDYTLDKARDELADAVDWLCKRDYVEIGNDESGEFAIVLRRPEQQR